MSTNVITPRQSSFIRSLLEERLKTLQIDNLEAYWEGVGISQLSTKAASEVIEKLKSIPADPNEEHAHITQQGRVIVNKLSKPCALCGNKVAPGTGWSVVTAHNTWSTYHKVGECPVPDTRLESVRDGYYALPSATGNNDLDFFWVHTSGGARTVDRIIGGHAPQPLPKSQKDAVTDRLVALSPEEAYEAQALYGREIGRCGRCGRLLTDETSRAVGLGPDCAQQL